MFWFLFLNLLSLAITYICICGYWIVKECSVHLSFIMKNIRGLLAHVTWTSFYVQLTGDVFAGVGPLAISAAKIVKRVFANDLNPYAVEYLERNSVLNKLEKKIKVCLVLSGHLLEVVFTFFFQLLTHETITMKKYVGKGFTFWICICCFLVIIMN